MKKILYLPLYERPCNYDFPFKIFNKSDFQVERLQKSNFGFKKTPADIDMICEWLLEKSIDAYGLVISIDMLVYGGLVQGRIHDFSLDNLKKRLDILKQIKRNNPKIIIYAFQLIMRCPSYSSSDAEPDYYEDFGKEIYRFGYLKHKIAMNLASPDEINEFSNICIPKVYISDFIKRREINREINLASLDLVSSEVIDFLVIPQDDSSEYGFTSIDQEIIIQEISNMDLMTKVYLYPGADEVGMILIARMNNFFLGKRPKFYIKYPSITSGQIIPNIEDRYLDSTVKYQIIASYGLVATSLDDADAVLLVNAPADLMLSSLSNNKEGRGMIANRNIVEAIEFVEYAWKHMRKPIVIADVTYGNGSTIEIYNYIKLKNMIFDLAGYAGWNTASNSIGSAIAQGVSYLNYGKTLEHMNFLILRYIEDIAYGGYIRQYIRDNVLKNYPNCSIYDIKPNKAELTIIILHELNKFITERMSDIKQNWLLKEVWLPWNRLYEVGIKIECIDKI